MFHDRFFLQQFNKSFPLYYSFLFFAASSTTANVTPLNLDVSDQSDKEDAPHCTPRSEKDIRDLVEIILSKVIDHLNVDEIDGRKNCCGDGKACEACRSEISKIVESVVEKVS